MNLTIYFIDGSSRRDVEIRDITYEGKEITTVDKYGNIMEYQSEHIAMIMLKPEEEN